MQESCQDFRPDLCRPRQSFLWLILGAASLPRPHYYSSQQDGRGSHNRPSHNLPHPVAFAGAPGAPRVAWPSNGQLSLLERGHPHCERLDADATRRTKRQHLVPWERFRVCIQLDQQRCNRGYCARPIRLIVILCSHSLADLEQRSCVRGPRLLLAVRHEQDALCAVRAAECQHLS